MPRISHGRFAGFDAPITHFSKHDSRNLTAARARLAELLRKDDAERRMVTPPEELPSWEWFNPRRRTFDRSVTHELLGDPGRERSALAANCAQSSPKIIQTDHPSWAGTIGHKWRLSSAAARAVLTRRGCRFPIGDVKSDDFCFCNKKRVAGRSYCALHAGLCERHE
jgi:hypothetical protein